MSLGWFHKLLESKDQLYILEGLQAQLMLCLCRGFNSQASNK